MIKKRQMTLGPHPPCGSGLARDQALVATRRLAVFADMGASLIVVANGLRMLRGGRA